MNTENENFNSDWLKNIFSNPFNWTGSKHRYLKELFDVLPLDYQNIKVLDPFVGGGDLISKLPVSWEVSAGDIMPLWNKNQTALITEKEFNDSPYRDLDKFKDLDWSDRKLLVDANVLSDEITVDFIDGVRFFSLLSSQLADEAIHNALVRVYFEN